MDDKKIVLIKDNKEFIFKTRMRYDNHIKNKKKYPQFKDLESNNLFNDVKHGRYFVYWNSELDIAEVELWYNGKTIC